MAQPFQDKVVVVTGAASGIGRATAIKLSELGATVVLTDINATGIDETVSLCSALVRKTTAAFDISSTHECKKFIDHIGKDLGKIDHVFNCAGINPTSLATEEISEEYWDRMVNCNLKGLFNITRAAIPYMPPGSTFVNVSSICGTLARPGFAVYCATKFGIIGFSKCMALELGPKGIRTNVVAPGSINTPTNAGVVAGEESINKLMRDVSIGRIGTPEEVADVVIFLMGDGARYMNGSVVEIDGGIGRGEM